MACLTRRTVLTNELESGDPVYLKKKKSVRLQNIYCLFNVYCSYLMFIAEHYIHVIVKEDHSCKFCISM